MWVEMCVWARSPFISDKSSGKQNMIFKLQFTYLHQDKLYFGNQIHYFYDSVTDI